VTAPVQQLLAAQQVAAQRQLTESLPFGPVVDYEVLPPPLDRIAAGSAASVPTIIGTNLNEAKLFALVDPSAQEIGRDSLIQRMTPLFGDRTAGA
jgi:para-nitrobenzyl esterase